MIVKPIAFVLAALIVVAALWVFFKPKHPDQQAADSAKGAGVNAPLAMTAPAGPPGQTAQSPSARNDVFELVIKGGKLVEGPAVLQVHQGEQVTLNIRSDSSDELHLHGYDLHARINPGEPVSLRFAADRTGRFGLELHKAHSELGALEVYPQ